MSSQYGTLCLTTSPANCGITVIIADKAVDAGSTVIPCGQCCNRPPTDSHILALLSRLMYELAAIETLVLIQLKAIRAEANHPEIINDKRGAITTGFQLRMSENIYLYSASS